MFSLLHLPLLAVAAQAYLLYLHSPRLTVSDSTGNQLRSEPYVLLTLQVTLSTAYTYNFGSSRLANSRRIGCKRYFETHLPSCGEG